MSIENRDLKPGTKLVARYKGREHTCEVMGTEAGIRYRLADGREFKSPSSAGSVVMGGTACNGWRFWSIAGEEPSGRTVIRAKPVGARPKKAAKTGAKKNGGGVNGLIIPPAASVRKSQVASCAISS